jgi:hypothetical protein
MPALTAVDFGMLEAIRFLIDFVMASGQLNLIQARLLIIIVLTFLQI